MNMDTELDLWRADWQSLAESPAPADLRMRVARQSRYMRILLMADILVTVVIGGGAILWAVLDPQPSQLLLAAATWLFIAVAWIFAITNRRNAWSPAASTTSAYLDLSIRRCRAGLRTVTFGAILYAAEMAFCLTWIYQQTHNLSITTLLTVALCTIVFAGFLIRYRKRKLADLNYLLNLQLE